MDQGTPRRQGPRHAREELPRLRHPGVRRRADLRVVVGRQRGRPGRVRPDRQGAVAGVAGQLREPARSRLLADGSRRTRVRERGRRRARRTGRVRREDGRQKVDRPAEARPRELLHAVPAGARREGCGTDPRHHHRGHLVRPGDREGELGERDAEAHGRDAATGDRAPGVRGRVADRVSRRRQRGRGTWRPSTRTRRCRRRCGN